MNQGLMAGTRRLMIAIVGLAVLAAPAFAQDRDRDGLDDGLEQALLERFRPTVVLSVGECDDAPARFAPNTDHPQAIARDGTIYGQATPFRARAGVELHYYHLWSRDCGRAGHALDAEHVSALVEASPDAAGVDGWRAVYWYAAAHEDTVCDATSGATAGALRAETVGPFVYVSRGKHASYFDPGHCRWGCGGDACAFAGPARHADIVNLGERGAPLNGATWVLSKRWPLAAKLSSDFDPLTRARLDRSNPAGVVGLMRHLQTTQAPLLAGDSTVDALAVGAAAAGTALDATGAALGTTGKAVGSALKRTTNAVARALGLK